MPNFIDLTGKQFGRLTVRSIASRNAGIRWLCRCECGGEATVLGQHLRAGRSASCGCLHREQLGSMVRTHGRTDSFEHRVWRGMRHRCSNPKAARYMDYGGRGICVCTRWGDFAAFLADMGPAPDTKHSIDRIDNDGDYGPENCRWATAKQQARNNSRNRMLTFRGETRCLAEWAEQLDLDAGTIYRRLRAGQTTDEALGVRPRYHPGRTDGTRDSFGRFGTKP